MAQKQQQQDVWSERQPDTRLESATKGYQKAKATDSAIGKAKTQSRDKQIDEALAKGIEHMKSHAHVMKKVSAAQDAVAKHGALQQQHASGKTRKRVSTKQGI